MQCPCCDSNYTIKAELKGNGEVSSAANTITAFDGQLKIPIKIKKELMQYCINAELHL